MEETRTTDTLKIGHAFCYKKHETDRQIAAYVTSYHGVSDRVAYNTLELLLLSTVRNKINIFITSNLKKRLHA